LTISAMAGLGGALRSLRPMAGRLAPRAPATRRAMGMQSVKQDPKLEQWNNVRDNVDELYDLTDPMTFMRTLVFAIIVPVAIYKYTVDEGFAPNGDGSTGVLFGPNSDTKPKPQGMSLPSAAVHQAPKSPA